MTFRQVELQKEYSVLSYIAIENIANIVHWNCCCQIYDGCPTIENFLNCDKDTVVIVSLSIVTILICFIKLKEILISWKH